MPNNSQKALLDSLIAIDGSHFETIRDNKAFNLGTKILYLERAIDQPCATFNESLNKLYNPNSFLMNRETKLRTPISFLIFFLISLAY